ncbi:DUF4113 domain-containing protein [Pantoea agglomerans]|nr:DUF4113 domain-containing protein [Pantoea agglomerans]
MFYRKSVDQAWQIKREMLSPAYTTH